MFNFRVPPVVGKIAARKGHDQTADRLGVLLRRRAVLLVNQDGDVEVGDSDAEEREGKLVEVEVVVDCQRVIGESLRNGEVATHPGVCPRSYRYRVEPPG